MTSTLIGVASFLLVAGTFALWWRRISGVQVPEDRRAFVASCGLAALLGVIALTGDPGWLAGTLAGVGVFGGALFSLLVWISPQRVAADAIAVGETLRSFEALDDSGNPVSIDAASGKPVLLKFFRGHW